jgi:hypothetical protein
MKAESVSRAIVIFQQSITPFAKNVPCSNHLFYKEKEKEGESERTNE